MTEDHTKFVIMLEPPVTATKEEYLQMLDSWLQEHEFMGRKMEEIFNRHNCVPGDGSDDDMMFYCFQGYTDLLNERIQKVAKHFGVPLEFSETRHGRHDA